MKKILYFFYEWLIFFPLFLTSTILTALTTILGCFIGSDRFWGYYPASIWSKFTCRLALIRIRTMGHEKLDKNQSYVFVANHQGAFDIFLIYGFLDHNFKWLMKKSLRKIPLVGKACESAGHVFVDRSSKSGIVKTLSLAKEKLSGGVSTVVFPEGSRTEDGKMHPFKKGAFQLALDLELPIVPLTINGSYRILKKDSILLSPGKMTLTIHNPIPTTGMTAENMPALMERTWHIIDEGLDKK
ncbi:MAG: 1-acyl-sn-glycerol-3-phosphate acyltransferase [Candidatus Azobacteroides sp.]|nr:1-acyl-sn-glycerol-3-phosphate acyltransferase [Candidatus Azobacteroides sp.]